MPQSKQRFAQPLRIVEILYLLMTGLSFYLLLLSRTGEARTVWDVLNPFFTLTLVVATFLLLSILFTSEKVPYKLLFIIFHSILIHSFFSVIFPAGDLSGQQIVLGRTRLVFDNAVLHGWTPWPLTVQSQIFEWFRGITFQAALSVVFARMLSIDLLYVHLFLVPVLWGAFIPIAAFLTTHVLTGNENVAVLSSLLISAFPYATYFGAISVPNSLGFIFFFYSLYFTLKNLDSDDSKTKFVMVTFSFFSFLFHFLTGIMSFSLLLLAIVFKSYRREKSSSTIAKVSLVISFLLCASLLPLSFIYLRSFNATYNTVFTLDKFYELPIGEIVGLFFLGELIYGFDLKTILLMIIGPATALLWMIYFSLSLKSNSRKGFELHTLFLFVAFLLILVDYRILKLFMAGLPLSEERLWVFRDFIAVPFVALAIWGLLSSIRGFLKAHSPQIISIVDIKRFKCSVLPAFSLILTLNILIPILLAGWITVSLSAAYPQIAPLQTTWYELEAVKYIEDNTLEKYVVIGDQWTIYAGEVIVGVNNPRAYYFLESNRTGYDLFSKMRSDPSPQVMIEAMNVNNASVAYFIITKPRLGTVEYNHIIQQAQQNDLQAYKIFYYPENEEKLTIFRYRKSTKN